MPKAPKDPRKEEKIDKSQLAVGIDIIKRS